MPNIICCPANSCCAGVCINDNTECCPGKPCTLPDGTQVCCGECDSCAVTGCCPPGGLVCPDGLCCNDGNPCTTDFCECTDSMCQSYTCTTQPACDDGNPCNGTETCSGGVCIPGTPLECDDGNACNGTETCSPGAGCIPGTPLNCADGNPCTNDICVVGACTHPPKCDSLAWVRLTL